MKCPLKYVGHSRVTIETCVTLGNLFQMGFKWVTHVLIDEAGQCTESKIMIAQVSKERGQVILAGRCYKQIRNKKYACAFDSRLVTKLFYNYWALPSIVNVHNILNADVIKMISVENSRQAQMLKQIIHLLPQSPKRPKTLGTFFFGLCSEEMQENDSASWYNRREAKNVS
uniref:Uncharacterized protein n=1 Tax=Glossina brevipalpis TaxID=37001 RepID=A0A1A9WUQ9_9MUSC